MLPNQVLNLLNFFDIFGYNSGYSHISKHQRVVNFLYFVHISIATVFVAYEFRLLSIYYFKLKLAEAFSECLQYTVALYTYWSIIFDSFVSRQTHTRFWNIVERLEQQKHICCCSCNCGNSTFTLRNYLIKLSLFGLKIGITCAIRLGGYSMQKFEIDAPYVVLFTLCEIRMFYYLLCLEIVHVQLKMIERKCRCVVKDETICCNIEDLRMHLKWIRQYFGNVHDMIDHLNVIFGWSNVTAISFSFCFILTELNWYYVHFENISPLNTFSKWVFFSLVLELNNLTKFLLDMKFDYFR